MDMQRLGAALDGWEGHQPARLSSLKQLRPPSARALGEPGAGPSLADHRRLLGQASMPSLREHQLQDELAVEARSRRWVGQLWVGQSGRGPAHGGCHRFVGRSSA